MDKLIVALSADIKELKSELEKAQGLVKNYGDNVEKTSSKASQGFNSVASSIGNLAAAYVGLQAAQALVGRAFNESIRLDSVKSALTQVLGSAELAEAQLKRLSESADFLGLNFLDLATSYKSFAAAAITSGQTLSDTNKIFDSVTKSAAVLKLSSEDVKLALNALGQMFSKGQIQAEELRGQLGERLPGAVSLLASSLGVTTKELNKMLDQGKVMASDLPKLADKLNETYGNSITQKVNTLQSAVNTLSNTFTKSLDSGAVGNFFKAIVNGANRALTSVEFLYKLLSNPPGTNLKAADFEKEFNKYSQLAKRGLTQTINKNAPQKELVTLQNEINSALEQNKKLTVDAIQIYGNQSGQVQRLNKEYETLKNQLGSVNKVVVPKPVEVETKASVNGLAKYRETLKNLTKEFENADIGSKRFYELSTQINAVNKQIQATEDLITKLNVGDSMKFTLDSVNPMADVDLTMLNAVEKELNDFQAQTNMLIGNFKELGIIGQESFAAITNTTAPNEAITELSANAENLVNILGNGLTSAFESALINGQNFGQVLVKALGDIIKRLLAAVAAAAILSAILAAMSGGKSTIAEVFKQILPKLTGFSFGGGKPSAGRVAGSVPTRDNGNQSVSFEIRGDKLYGVLENYQTRLNSLA